MPFKSTAQMQACFSKGDPRWDCNKALEETPLCRLPYRVGTSKRSGDRPCKGSKCGVSVGPRGGTFVLCKNSRKVHLPKKSAASRGALRKQSPPCTHRSMAEIRGFIKTHAELTGLKARRKDELCGLIAKRSPRLYRELTGYVLP